MLFGTLICNDLHPENHCKSSLSASKKQVKTRANHCKSLQITNLEKTLEKIKFIAPETKTLYFCRKNVFLHSQFSRIPASTQPQRNATQLQRNATQPQRSRNANHVFRHRALHCVAL